MKIDEIRESIPELFELFQILESYKEKYTHAIDGVALGAGVKPSILKRYISDLYSDRIKLKRSESEEYCNLIDGIG